MDTVLIGSTGAQIIMVNSVQVLTQGSVALLLVLLGARGRRTKHATLTRCRLPVHRRQGNEMLTATIVQGASEDRYGLRVLILNAGPVWGLGLHDDVAPSLGMTTQDYL